MTFYRVPTEFLLAILCALTAHTLCALHFHGVRTALSRRLHCALTALSLRLHCADCVTSKDVCKYQELQIQPIKPKKNSRNNYMFNIKNNQNTREHIVNRVSSYFLKR